MNTTVRQTLFNKRKRLDVIDGTAVLAYSLRQLRRSYSGFAVRVRRSSDNSETDIGFRNGVLDIETLESFCGVGNGFVSVWYDCSGNGNHATATVTTAQPQIVINGVCYLVNNKPSIFASPGRNFQIPLNVFTTLTAATEHAVFRTLSELGAYARLSSNPDGSHSPFFADGAYLSFLNSTRLLFPGYPPNTGIAFHSSTNNGTSLSIFKNNVAYGSIATNFNTSPTFGLLPDQSSGELSISEYIITSTADQLPFDKFNNYYKIV